METTYDITGKIREYLLGRTSVTNLVGERIFSPAFSHTTAENGDEYVNEPDPKVMFEQAGGQFNYRYLFITQAATQQGAREVAVAVVNALSRGRLNIVAGSPETTVITNCTPEGGLVDSRNEVTKAPQVMFYVTFEAV